MYVDETLNCTDCNAPFTFTSGEQRFFATKGFTNKPTRCSECRAARKAQTGRYTGGAYDAPPRAPREMFTVRCGQCGGEAKVPFEPRLDKPVFCRDCFDTRRSVR
jgi:CxxC-x17-CxxC domain-containing protein